MYKEAHFVEKLKLDYKWANMLDEKGDFNTKEDDVLVQTTRKPSRGMPKNVNTKSSKARNLEKKNEV